MATAAVQDFLTKVSEDQDLQGELGKALEAENDREAVAALAQAKGYEFTSEELWQEIQARQAEFERRQTAGELTDEELEAVAGGGTPLIISVIASVGVFGASVTIGATVGMKQPAKW